MSKPVWIAGIARGHNAGVCPLKDGEVVFAVEEERLSRQKYDGGPIASMVKILEYTDKLDYPVVAPHKNYKKQQVELTIVVTMFTLDLHENLV